MQSALLASLEEAVTLEHAYHMSNLMQNCSEYYSLIHTLRKSEIEITKLMGENNYDLIRRYIVVNRQKCDFEQRYMFIQGIKSILEIGHYLDNEALDKSLLRYDIDIEEFED